MYNLGLFYQFLSGGGAFIAPTVPDVPALLLVSDSGYIERFVNCSVVRHVDGEVVIKYRHPAPVYGCDWNPNNKYVLSSQVASGH